MWLLLLEIRTDCRDKDVWSESRKYLKLVARPTSVSEQILTIVSDHSWPERAIHVVRAIWRQYPPYTPHVLHKLYMYTYLYVCETINTIGKSLLGLPPNPPDKSHLCQWYWKRLRYTTDQYTLHQRADWGGGGKNSPLLDFIGMRVRLSRLSCLWVGKMSRRRPRRLYNGVWGTEEFCIVMVLVVCGVWGYYTRCSGCQCQLLGWGWERLASTQPTTHISGFKLSAACLPALLVLSAQDFLAQEENGGGMKSILKCQQPWRRYCPDEVTKSWQCKYQQSMWVCRTGQERHHGLCSAYSILTFSLIHQHINGLIH